MTDQDHAFISAQYDELLLRYQKVRKVLVDLVGADTEKELRDIEFCIRSIRDIPEHDRAITLNGIQALLDTQ